MTDSSMNFGPAWIRNMRSEGTTGGGTSSGARYQLAEHRYGREEMLALYDKSAKPPPSLIAFKSLYSEPTLTPLALLPTTEEERAWQTRPTSISGPTRGRGGSLERGGRVNRGRGAYQSYGRASSAYDSGWGNGEQPDWSPRKDFNTRNAMMDNWRRTRNNSEEDDGWRNINSNRSLHEKWGRSTSWRGEGDAEERNGPPERGGRPTWHDLNRGISRKSWDNEDHLPEWANENPTEGGGTFDERGAFHGSDDEQGDHKNHRKELHKSTSQQHINNKAQHYSLPSSKSTTSLLKSEENEHLESSNERDSRENSKSKENQSPEKDKVKSNIPEKIDKDEIVKEERKQEELRIKTSEKSSSDSVPPLPDPTPSSNIDKVEEEFARMQEDLVLKLVVDEETPKSQSSSNFDMSGVQPPPNLVPPTPSQDKWYYQDPQGTRQGPFLNVEMAEWYKAGYFSNQLNVMRECDERYFLLGELINLCGGENPFLSGIRFPILKNENTPTTKLTDDMLPYQLLSQLAFKQQVSMRNLAEPWSALTLQQQELAAQRLLLQQQQQQLSQDLQYLQNAPANPLMYMINQMQQGTKMPGSVLVEKPNNSVPNQLDPLLTQMGGMHSLQNRIPTPGLHNHLSGGLPANLSSSLPSDTLSGGLSGLPTGSLPSPGLTMPGLHGGLPTNLNVNRPTSHSPIDQLPTNPENDPITNFLKQFHQQKQQQRSQIPLDGSMWHKTNQYNIPQNAAPPTQWVQPSEPPISMWDLQTPTISSTSLPSDVQPVPMDKSITPQQQQQHQQVSQEKDKEQRLKDEITHKELKKKKEQEEKQAKKDAEEKRKQEQRKQEAEKKATEDKKKKEEEKIRKELERAKKEAEEKRMRELEEKRRLKEQRKAEEETRKKLEEQKKLDDERLKREAKDREDRKQAEAARLAQNQVIKTAKTAPWCQSNSTQGMSLTDIQKAEKERRAQEAAMILKQQQIQEQHQQQHAEKAGGLQLNWAKKPIEPRKVKSFAEIQAEEQEKLTKLTAEARLAAQQREKEAPIPSNAGSIWNGQSLTWASTTPQWSSNNTGSGFWDDVLVKSSTKPSTVSKSNVPSAMTTSSTTAINKPPPQQQQQQQQQLQKQAKPKSKKEEPQQKSVNNNNNNSANDEFTNWCYKTLSALSTDVDIPTFVSFLRDIESAYDVRDYCKEYLGDGAATQQFATNFLEKRRSFKPKNNAHKDDMCSPAPAITPSTQHSTEFQEVKGKNKKNKKSKMLKVDSRILGFQVTSAPDRINVGDRDYGDNS